MNRSLIKPLLKPLFRDAAVCRRWVYDFNGINNFGQFSDSEILKNIGIQTLEFETGQIPPEVTNGDRRVVIFTKHTPGMLWSARPFHFITNSIGQMQIQFGGPSFVTGNERIQSNRKYKLEVDFTNRKLVLLVNDVASWSTAFSTGPGLSNFAHPFFFGGTTSEEFFLLGQFFNIKVNGVLYPLNDPTSNFQSSVPENGNRLTLFNVNPVRWAQIPCSFNS